MQVRPPERFLYQQHSRLSQWKPFAPGPRDSGSDGRWSPPGIGRFEAASVPLALLIQLAFGINEAQIAGQPSWFASELFDVTAKPEPGIALTREELKPRLQNLLRQRFHLQTHYEVRSVPGYALRIAKGGPKLQPTKGDHFPGFRINVGPGELHGANWSMAILAAQLQSPAGLPVIDRTGLTGSYDLHLTFASDGETESTMPSIFTALRETLGLELKPQKVPLQILVIDHIDRVPVAN